MPTITAEGVKTKTVGVSPIPSIYLNADKYWTDAMERTGARRIDFQTTDSTNAISIKMPDRIDI